MRGGLWGGHQLHPHYSYYQWVGCSSPPPWLLNGGSHRLLLQRWREDGATTALRAGHLAAVTSLAWIEPSASSTSSTAEEGEEHLNNTVAGWWLASGDEFGVLKLWHCHSSAANSSRKGANAATRRAAPRITSLSAHAASLNE